MNANDSKHKETKEDDEAQMEKYAEAVEYYIEHPEAPLDPVLRAYVNSVKREVERLEQKEQEGKAR